MRRFFARIYWKVLVALDERWILNPKIPMWFVDEELRAIGLDPDEIGERGEELGRALRAAEAFGVCPKCYRLRPAGHDGPHDLANYEDM